MPCKEWREEWVAHLYGELTAEEQQTIEEHLSSCSACSETMQELEASRHALASSVPSVPEAPRVVVLPPRRAWHPVWSFAMGAAAAMLVFFFGALLTTPRTQLLEERIAQLEAAPLAASVASGDDEILTRAQFDEEMQRLARRQRRERAEDLDYLARYLAASEQRNGKFMDRTQEALAYLALRGDPRVSER